MMLWHWREGGREWEEGLLNTRNPYKVAIIAAREADTGEHSTIPVEVRAEGDALSEVWIVEREERTVVDYTAKRRGYLDADASSDLRPE